MSKQKSIRRVVEDIMDLLLSDGETWGKDTRQEIAKIIQSERDRHEEEKRESVNSLLYDLAKKYPNERFGILSKAHTVKLQTDERNRVLKIALTMGDCFINDPMADAGWLQFQSQFVQALTNPQDKQ